MNILGLDIGGANIKAATSDGVAISVPFAIWKEPQRLTSELTDLSLNRGRAFDLIALTMTAELADCFATRAEGVAHVIRCVESAYPNVPVRVWLTSGEFAEPSDALELPMLVAAANWHALATWAARAVPTGPALLVDIGSTTTDIIPLLDGHPISEGTSDVTRLAASELLYTGVRRTPVCAMVRAVPLPDDWDGPRSSTGMLPLAAELFATSLDVHLLTGDIPDEAHDLQTADGRPATRAAAVNRLAHMLCCDPTELTSSQVEGIAAFIAETQIREIAAAIRNRAEYTLSQTGPAAHDRSLPVLISGSGSWLAEKALSEVSGIRFDPLINLSAMFIRNVSPSATAFAVARLAAERCQHDVLPWSVL